MNQTPSKGEVIYEFTSRYIVRKIINKLPKEAHFNATNIKCFLKHG